MTPDISKFPVRGIVTSSHNGDIRHALIGRNFWAGRASIGNATDAAFAADLKTAKKFPGIVATIAYHYLILPGPGDGTQAKRFLASVKDADILCLDIESTALRKPAVGKGFIAYVRAHDPLKREILLYSSEGTWPGNLGQDGNWVANWSRRPSISFDFWQYQGDPLDRDVYNGSLTSLKTWLPS